MKLKIWLGFLTLNLCSFLAAEYGHAISHGDFLWGVFSLLSVASAVYLVRKCELQWRGIVGFLMLLFLFQFRTFELLLSIIIWKIRGFSP